MFVTIVVWLVFVSSLLYMYRHIDREEIEVSHQYHYTLSVLVFIFLMPMLQYTGSGFEWWDAVVSWHRWALELYANQYTPIDAAYPVFLPALWAMLYKIQNTNEVWWTSRVVMFIFPFYVTMLSLTLYKEYKNSVFLCIVILLYPYLLWSETIAGSMDMPVMIMGMISLITMYAAALNKKKTTYIYYVYGSLLLAGIASIVKQAGLVFIVFDFIYILLNIKLFNNKKQLLVVLFLSMSYFLTYLSLYYINGTHGATGNINWLKYLSTSRTLDEFMDMFFAYPPQLPFTRWLTDVPRITPYLLGLSVGLLIFKKARQVNSIGFLSLIFVLIGFYAWTEYFSYDARNSYWVKVFVIMFIAINLGYLIDWYFAKKRNPMIPLLLVLVLPIVYFVHLGDAFTYKKQLAYQKNLGDAKRIQYIVKEIKPTSECVKLYTNNHFLTYNVYAKQIHDKLFAKEFDIDFLRQSVENDCKDGAFILFRYTTSTYPFWKNVQKLIDDKKIEKYKGSNYFFHVPAYSKLKENYFD